MSGIGVKMILIMAFILIGASNVDGFVGTRKGILEQTGQFFQRLFSGSSSSNGRDADDGKSNVIFPGTRWCGDGNIAWNYNDLGSFYRTDSCCRDHDHCSNVLEPLESLDTIINDGSFARTHCWCDEQFYNCLRNVNSLASSAVGKKFFTKMRPQCFAKTYPVTECIDWGSWRFSGAKCLQWKVDSSRRPIYQWFDNPDYDERQRYRNHVYPRF